MPHVITTLPLDKGSKELNELIQKVICASEQALTEDVVSGTAHHISCDSLPIAEKTAVVAEEALTI